MRNRQKLHRRDLGAKKQAEEISVNQENEIKVMLGYCFTPYQRLWLYNGARLVAFYDTLGIRRMYSRLKPPASSRGRNVGKGIIWHWFSCQVAWYTSFLFLVEFCAKSSSRAQKFEVWKKRTITIEMWQMTNGIYNILKMYQKLYWWVQFQKNLPQNEGEWRQRDSQQMCP